MSGDGRAHRATRVRLSAALVLLALAAGGWGRAQQVNQPVLGRSVHGLVLDARNQPLPSAVVYLTNLRTKAIHTAITDDHGGYSFHQLEPRTGYEVYAVWQGRRSPARTDSEYETAKDVRLDLKIPVE